MVLLLWQTGASRRRWPKVRFCFLHIVYFFENGAIGFLYARCAVVANGRETYYRILAHPEEMPQDIEFEALLYLPEQAWQLRTGKEEWDYFPLFNYEAGFNEEGWGPQAIKL